MHGSIQIELYIVLQKNFALKILINVQESRNVKWSKSREIRMKISYTEVLSCCLVIFIGAGTDADDVDEDDDGPLALA